MIFLLPVYRIKILSYDFEVYSYVYTRANCQGGTGYNNLYIDGGIDLRRTKLIIVNSPKIYKFYCDND